MEIYSTLLAICAGIHRSPVNSPHKGQWRGAKMFSLICAWIKGWVNNGEAGDLRHHGAHYDVIVMCSRRFRIWEPWHLGYAAMRFYFETIYHYMKQHLRPIHQSFVSHDVKRQIKLFWYFISMNFRMSVFWNVFGRRTYLAQCHNQK